MTLRVRKEGNSLYPERAIIVGPLSEILASTPADGAVAEPTDAVATLRYSSTKGWQGTFVDPSSGDNRFLGEVERQRPSLEAGLGVDLFALIFGTSSDRRCATPNVDLLTEVSSVTGSAEYCDGWWRHMQTRFGTQFSLAWNGAVAGDLWTDTAAKIASDFAGGSMPRADFAFLRAGANDIANGATAASISASIRAVVEGQFLARGIKVCLITSHTNNPLGSATLAEYRNLAAFFDQLVTEYPGLVMHANTFAAFGEAVTPLANLLDTQHLNEDGTEVAVAAFEDVCRVWGLPNRSRNPEDFGEIIMEIDPTNAAGLTTASATQAVGTPDEDKKARILLTNTANGGRIIQSSLAPGKTLAAGDLCRLWCDVEPEAGSSTSSIYMAGVGLRNAAGVADSKRFGAYSSGATYGPQNGNKIQGWSRVFTVPASLLTDPQLYATAGAGTNSAQVGRCALVRVKRAAEVADQVSKYMQLDPITKLQVLDPRKGKSVKATLIRGTVTVDIKDADELLIFGSNATTATNSMSTTLMDATIAKAVLAEGAALSSAMVSIPHPVGESASVIAATNAAGFAVTTGA